MWLAWIYTRRAKSTGHRFQTSRRILMPGSTCLKDALGQKPATVHPEALTSRRAFGHADANASLRVNRGVLGLRRVSNELGKPLSRAASPLP